MSAKTVQAFWNEEKPQNTHLGNVAENKSKGGEDSTWKASALSPAE